MAATPGSGRLGAFPQVSAPRAGAHGDPTPAEARWQRPVAAVSATVRTPSPFPRIAVVGAGLIGGSFALVSGVTPGVATVSLWDRDPDTRRRARAAGVGDAVPDRLEDALDGADLVVLAVPVGATADAARAVLEATQNDPVLTDVGSVKARPVREVEAVLGEHGRSGVRFVGGHPMAGSERSGIAAADGTIFQGATWLLTPTDRSDPDAFNALGTHLRAIGARVLAVDPDLHDRLVAVASHLPQALASALMAQASRVAQTSGQAVLSVAAGGFRDVTRIAASDPDLWVGILSENRDAVLTALDGFGERLSALRAALEDRDAGRLREVLAAAQTARLALPGKEAVGDLVDLVVPMDDRPGILAGVTTALGEAGVNIEDLAMRHASEGTRGALVVAVAGHDAAVAAQQLLAGRGFPSHLEPR